MKPLHHPNRDMFVKECVWRVVYPYPRIVRKRTRRLSRRVPLWQMRLQRRRRITC